MGVQDWAYLRDGADVAVIDRGVTAGVAAPPGGGQFIWAANSLTVDPGCVAMFVSLQDFAPMAKGGSIRGCIQRGPGGGARGFSPYFFMCCGGTSVNDRAYLLGLSDTDPHRIVLRKGAVEAGIPDDEGDGVLLRSSASFLQGTWLHIRLDVVVNPNGDVVLEVFSSDLDAHPLGQAPDWQPVDGMPRFIDDHLGINSGEQPFTSGRAGFALESRDVIRRGYFDHLEVFRQL